MKDRNMQPFSANGGQTGIRISQNQQGVRTDFHHQLIGRGNNISNCLTQVCTRGIQIYFRFIQPQIPEKHAI